NFSDILNRAAYGGERVIVHSGKKPVAAVVPIEDLDLIERLEDELDVKAAMKTLKEPGAIACETVKKKLRLRKSPMAYAIHFKRAALRQLEKLPRSIQKRIGMKIEALRQDPFPAGSKKLSGLADTWRVRAGDYRVVYQVQQEILLVLVLTVGHRREV